MIGWHHWLNGHEFEQALGVGDGQGSLACCSPWGCKKSDTTERLITFLGGNLNGHMLVSVCAVLAWLCPILWDPMVCSPPGFSVHGILQAKILQWVAMPSSRGSSQPRDQTQTSRIVGCATREALVSVCRNATDFVCWTCFLPSCWTQFWEFFDLSDHLWIFSRIFGIFYVETHGICSFISSFPIYILSFFLSPLVE